MSVKHERTSINVGNSDQVIVTLDKDADINYLRAALDINPIEIIFTDVGDGLFSYMATYPKGLAVKKLEYVKHSHLMPDVGVDPYTRFLQDRPAGTGFHLHLTEVNDDVLHDLVQFPVVFKMNQGNGFLVASPKVWRITRSEFAKNRYIADPCSVPESVERLMDLLDEPLPESKESLLLHKKRLELRLGLINWYQQRLLAYDVAEALKGYSERLHDELIACEQQMLVFTGAISSFKELYQSIWLKSLMLHVPEHVAEQLRQDAMRKATNRMSNSKRTFKNVANSPISTISIEELSNVFTDFTDHPGFKEGMELLNNHGLDKMLIHHCGACGSRPSFEKKEVRGSVFTMSCSSCSNKLPHNLCSTDLIGTILAWNKRNPHSQPLHVLRNIFGGRFSDLNMDYVRAFHSRVSALLNIIRPDLIAHHNAFKTNTTRDLLQRHNANFYLLGHLDLLLQQVKNAESLSS